VSVPTPKFNDARATWELLSEGERSALAVLVRSKGHVITPGMLGRELHVTRQRAALLARSLKSLGLAIVKSLPKQTSYEITRQGEACLAEGRSEILAWGTVTDYNRGTPLRPATREEWQQSRDITASDAPGGYVGAWG
jgi:hypothetical protein